MTRLLASVSSMHEAFLAYRHGVDFIDLKNPAEGALGALPLPLIRDIVAALAGRSTLSATIGDLPMEPQLLSRRVVEVSETGVDIIKIGFFGRDNHRACVQTLSGLTKKNRLIAVFLADQGFDLSLLPLLSQAGFYGVMLDTADKLGGRLTDWLTRKQMQDFIRFGQGEGLLCGLAGSLSLEDVPLLSNLGADYLGFRRALCANLERDGRLNPLILENLKGLLRKCDTSGVV